MNNPNALGETGTRPGAATGTIDSTTDHLTSRAHEGIDTLANSASAAERRIREKAAKAGAQLGTAAGRAREKGTQVQASVRAYTGNHPLASLALAFIAGVLLTAIARR